MAKQVMNKATGVISDVPDNHWALTSSDFIVIEEAQKEEVIASLLDNFTIPQLKKAAEVYEIDLGDATKKADIIAVLELAEISAEDVEEAQKE